MWWWFELGAYALIYFSQSVVVYLLSVRAYARLNADENYDLFGRLDRTELTLYSILLLPLFLCYYWQYTSRSWREQVALPLIISQLVLFISYYYG
ncbi:MAG: hypothetical protein WBA17_15360 [Saprospiraceae bacterium]